MTGQRWHAWRMSMRRDTIARLDHFAKVVRRTERHAAAEERVRHGWAWQRQMTAGRRLADLKDWER